MEDDFELEDKSPCESCDRYCDGWDARYCCTLCEWLGHSESDCDRCDPMDI